MTLAFPRLGPTYVLPYTKAHICNEKRLDGKTVRRSAARVESGVIEVAVLIWRVHLLQVIKDRAAPRSKHHRRS